MKGFLRRGRFAERCDTLKRWRGFYLLRCCRYQVQEYLLVVTILERQIAPRCRESLVFLGLFTVRTAGSALEVTARISIVAFDYGLLVGFIFMLWTSGFRAPLRLSNSFAAQ